MAKKELHPAAAVLKDQMEGAAKETLKEIKDLKKDLAGLERFLSTAKQTGTFPLLDIVHSAYEIHRRASEFLFCRHLMAEMEDGTTQAGALALLERHGATRLKKPAGWHWISPDGEMHKLTPTDDPLKAAASLERILAPRPEPAPEEQQSAPPKAEATAKTAPARKATNSPKATSTRSPARKPPAKK